MSLGLSLRGLLIRLPSLSPLCACPHLHSAVSGLPHLSLGDFPQDLFTSLSTGTLVFPSQAPQRGGQKKLCHFLALNPSGAPLSLGMSCAFLSVGHYCGSGQPSWPHLLPLSPLLSASQASSQAQDPPLLPLPQGLCTCSFHPLSPPLIWLHPGGLSVPQESLVDPPRRRTGRPTPPLSAFVIRGTARRS